MGARRGLAASAILAANGKVSSRDSVARGANHAWCAELLGRRGARESRAEFGRAPGEKPDRPLLEDREGGDRAVTFTRGRKPPPASPPLRLPEGALRRRGALSNFNAWRWRESERGGHRIGRVKEERTVSRAVLGRAMDEATTVDRPDLRLGKERGGVS